MSTLYLIRHGQATYIQDEPPLTELGGEQALHLGRHAALRKWGLDAIYQGPRLRQIDTARHFMAAARAGGMKCPEPTQLDDFDEYHAQAILRVCTPRLCQAGGEFEGLFAVDSREEPREQRRRFNRFFDRAIEHWLRGDLDGEAVEPFPVFCARVKRGIHQVIEREGRGKRVAVFTSAGCVAASMRVALGIDEAATLKMASIVMNTSITEYRFRDARELTLVGFNAVPHLENHAQIT